MKPLITALVDTYNHERYIEQALASVLEQGLSPAELEIVVVDDGSTDKTPAIIQKFLPRVKHVRKKNGGQASAFNAGFAESHGEIVAILDGDDWWAKGKLAAVVGALETNPDVGAVTHGHYQFDQRTSRTKLCVPSARQTVSISNQESTVAAIRAWPFFLMGALTVRRNVLEWIMPLAEEMTFMADTAFQAAAMAKGTLVLPEALFYYRYHADNLYAIDPGDLARLRRRYEMTELVCSKVYSRLVELGVPEDSVSLLLSGVWLDAKRSRLSKFGGSRFEALEAELHAFRATYRNPSLGYRLFKYVFVGGASLLLPARRFYGIRNWYAERQLGRYRERLVRDGASESENPSSNSSA